MEALDLFDKILFKIGLVRVKKSATTIVHKNGVMSVSANNLSMIENMVMFIAVYIIENCNKGISPHIKGARVYDLADSITSYLEDKIKEYEIK